MALNIKDDETDRLARELASLSGESITKAVRVAMEERLKRVRRSQAGTSGTRFDHLRRYIDRCRVRRTDDRRPEAEIFGYDESGLPT